MGIDFTPNIEQTVGMAAGTIESLGAAFEGDDVVLYLELVLAEVEKQLAEARAK